MNCPLTKEEFCTAINTVKDYWNNKRKIEEAVGVVFSEGATTDIIDNYLTTLSLVMKDELIKNSPAHDIPWIIYFCCEKDFGRGYKEGDVKISGFEFPLTSPEELYDLLIKLYWEED